MTARLHLPTVTLCAAASVNLTATVAALQRCLDHADFARAILFSDTCPPDLPQGVEWVRVTRMESSSDYSRFVLHQLPLSIQTQHCLIVQWDGFVLDASAWDMGFLEVDYIGAPWPQFDDGHDVGNGGFSLRSKRLMEACALPGFIDSGEAEDVVIARRNRDFLERQCGMRFADRAQASSFSFERDRTAAHSFGFHGVFNLPDAIGIEGFWEIYTGLDERGTVRTDFWPLLRAVMSGPRGLRRAMRLIVDRWRA